jgi:8-oxo-dGTP diphosphatase
MQQPHLNAVTTVVAAVIERDGRILIAQRDAASWHPLKWEFPGGKVEPDETAEEAVIRELQEELAIQARIHGEITRYEYQYPGRLPILLIFYRIVDFTGEPQNLQFEQIRWESPERLHEYDFLEGDKEFLLKYP